MSIQQGAEKNASSDESTNLETLLDGIRDEIESADHVTLQDVLEAVGTRAYGPLLLIPGLLALAPTGAIPGMSIVTGTIILIISAQLLVGRPQPWLPRRALDFSFSRDTLVSAIERGTPYARRIDKFLKPSLSRFTEFPATRIIAVVTIALALTMYPLALLPFAVAIPSMAIVLFALGLTARDGRLILAGFIVSGLSVIALTYALM